jgi:DNA invertase Pin-like site-specific DNA recombinase
MISDALAGRIDIILTKSVSRFARNTVDSLTIIRQLKEKGVFVYFEKENIDTGDAKGELLITIMSSLAQEESRSISENTTWGQRKRMADGKVSLPYSHFLGYEKGDDGLPQIIESEAEIVRLIYKMYLNGCTVNNIAKYLTERGIPTPSGKEKWSVSTTLSILQNEKYKGVAVLQKGYTVDFLTKKRKKNQGEIPMYYVENSHPGIVSEEVWDLVQAEIQRHKSTGTKRSGAHCFSSMIYCGECSGTFGSKVWHSTVQYKRTIWQCNEKYKKKGTVACHTPHLTEAQIEYAFITAFNQMLEDKEIYFGEYDTIVEMLTETAALDKEAEKLNDEVVSVYELILQSIEQNARIAQNQDDYNRRAAKLEKQYTAAKARLDVIAAEKQERTVRRERLNRFLDDLRRQDAFLAEFDPALFRATVDKITVYTEQDIAVTFRDGSEIHVSVLGK